MGVHLRVDPKLPRPFRRLVLAAWASNTGDGVRNAALPLIAAGLTMSASTVSAVAAAGTLPFVLLGVLAGTLADREARVPLIVRAHLFRAVVMGGLAAMLLLDEMTIALLAAGAFLLGCGEALADSAAPALIPDLVDHHRLEEANGQLETAELVANDLVGPPLGGALFAVTSSVPFAINAVSFAGAATLVNSIRGAEQPIDLDDERPRWRDDLREGIVTAWTNPVLRTTGALILVLQLGNVAAVAPLVVYLTEHLDLDPAAYGLFLAAGSVGGIAGSRLVSRIVARIGPFRTLIWSLAVSTVAFLSMMVPTVPTAALGFAASFGAVVVGRVVVVAARQRSVPSRLLGRAQGAMRTLVWGAATIGALVGGALYDAVDPRAPFALAAALYLAGLVGGWRSLRRVLSPVT